MIIFIPIELFLIFSIFSVLNLVVVVVTCEKDKRYRREDTDNIKMWIRLAVFTWSVLVSAGDESWRMINTDQGPVKGYKIPEEDYFGFFGIPYATTPIGPDKFKAPLPPLTWDETFEATEKYIICPQTHRDRDNFNQLLKSQEDCLITNIYVPITRESNLPVVVHFHGGAYQFGYGNMKTFINLLKSKKIIIVNFNYRLGAHGLLCLGTKDIPGNAGMKDQIALLKWVQRNIANFGGNPNDVTIDGWSAGASAVDLVMISPMARGLFHKVIPESGSNAASFSVQVDPLYNAKNIAKRLGFNGDVDNLDALESFYKNVTFEILYSLDFNNEPDSSTIFAPCIERDLGQEMFLEDYPVNILKTGNYQKVPMLYGISEMEGIYRTNNFDTWSQIMNTDFAYFFPVDLTFPSEQRKNQVAEVVRQFYFGDGPIGEDDLLNYVDYFTDVMFAHGTAKAVDLHLKAGNDQIYLYVYAFTDQSDSYILNTTTRGASHCAQTAAITDLDDEENISEIYKNVKGFMRDMWLNFITTGKPVPEGSSYPAWPPVGKNRSPYMYINDTLTLKQVFLGVRGFLWDRIYDKYYKTPIPPTP